MALKKIAIYMTMAAMSLPSVAQDLDETFNIEGVYDTKITKQERIAQLPSQLNLKMAHQVLQYSSTGVPVNIESFLTPLTAAGWKDSFDYYRSRGYFDFGMGSYLDIVGSAGYRFIDNDKTAVGVKLQHTSSSAFNPYKDRDPKPASRKLFDEYIGLYGSHLLDNAGRIDASLNYRLGYFNYYGLLADMSDFDQPSQTTNTFDVKVGFTSLRDRSLLWNVGVEYNYFGYRRMYLASGQEMRGLKQSVVSVDGNVAYRFAPSLTLRHGIGMDVRADFVLFGSQQSDVALTHPLDNYSRIGLTPHYAFEKGAFTGRLGAKFDFLANAGPEGDRYPVFRVAPDVNLGYRAGRFGIGLQAGGGVELNTLQRNAALDRFTTPWLSSTAPIYSPIDGKITLDFGSFSGLSAQLAFAYKVTNKQPLEGRYMQYLSRQLTDANLAAETIDVKGFSLQAGVRYVYSNLFEVNANLAYQPQNGEKGYFNGLDRPRWLLDANLALTPIKGLRADLGFQYRGVRTLYGLDNPTLTEDLLSYQRLPDVADLSLGVSYEVLPSLLTLWVRADNLLGKDAYLNPLLPQPGIAVMGGVALKF